MAKIKKGDVIVRNDTCTGVDWNEFEDQRINLHAVSSITGPEADGIDTYFMNGSVKAKLGFDGKDLILRFKPGGNVTVAKKFRESTSEGDGVKELVELCGKNELKKIFSPKASSDVNPGPRSLKEKVKKIF